MKRTERVVSMSDKCMLALLMCLAWAALAMMPLHPAFAVYEELPNPGLELVSPATDYESHSGQSNGVYGKKAQNWRDYSYDDSDRYLDLNVDYERQASGSGLTHHGISAQKIDVRAIGAGAGTQFGRQIALASTRIYVASVWLRTSSGSMNVTVSLIRDADPWTTYAQQTNIPIGTTWKQVSIMAFPAVTLAGRFQIRLLGAGILYVDDASVKSYSSSGEAAEAIQAAIYATPSGGKLTIPAGTYQIGPSIRIARPIRLAGTMDGETKLTRMQRANESSSRTVFTVMATGGGRVQDVEIANVDFYGLPQQAAPRADVNDDKDVGIYINDADKFCIINCSFVNFGMSGISAVDSNGVISLGWFKDIYRSSIANLGYGVFVDGGGGVNWGDPVLYGDADSEGGGRGVCGTLLLH